MRLKFLANRNLRIILFPFTFAPLIVFLAFKPRYFHLVLYNWKLAMLIFIFPFLSTILMFVPQLKIGSLPHPKLPKLPKQTIKLGRLKRKKPSASPCLSGKYVGFLKANPLIKIPNECFNCPYFSKCVGLKHDVKKPLILAVSLSVLLAFIVWYFSIYGMPFS